MSQGAFVASQYQAQDDFGQYNYGYSNPHSSKTESKTADGVTRGSYSYIDANNELQRVDYIADVMGFRTVATNLPVAPEPVEYTEEGVTSMPIEEVLKNAKLTSAEPQLVTAHHGLAPSVGYSYLPYATNYGYFFNPIYASQPQLVNYAPQGVAYAQIAPAPVAEAEPVSHDAVVNSSPDTVPEPETYVQPEPAVAPEVAPRAPAPESVPDLPAPEAVPFPENPGVNVPVVPEGVTQLQYHAQDEDGQYNFGYADPNSSKSESRKADGTVTGSYNYIDSDGKLQTVHYIADEQGFRVAGTNIPVAVYELPKPVEDTPEVKAAKEQHALLVAEEEAEVAAAADESADATVWYPASIPVIEPAPKTQYPKEVPAIPLSEIQPARKIVKVIKPVAQPVIELTTADDVDLRAAAPEPAPVPKPVVPTEAPVIAAPEPVVFSAPATYASNYAYVLHPGQGLPGGSEPVQLSPGTPINYQYHAQDEFGQYNFGYSNPLSAKQESKTADGIVRGSYSYLDANNRIQTVQYISDALGFRAAGTNFPGAASDAGIGPIAPAMEAQVAYSYLPYAVQHPYFL